MARRGAVHLQPQRPYAERDHRRRVALAIGMLIALGTSPVFGHHVAGAFEPMFAGRDHFLSICLIALHDIFAPVHELSHVVFAGGVAYAIFERASAIIRSRRTLALLVTVPASEHRALKEPARALGLSDRLSAVDGLPVAAFTSGVFRPRVYVAADLVNRLQPGELRAVLAHEAAHVRRRDPLRLSLLRFLAAALFYIPVLRRLADDAADEAEILADDEAMRTDRLALASAIVKLARPTAGVPSPAFGVGFQSMQLTSRRVHRLLGLEAPIRTHVTRRSVGGAAVILSIVWISGLLMVHPLPAGAVVAVRSDEHGSHSHCEHRGASAWTHVFCRGLRVSMHGERCPHAHG